MKHRDFDMTKKTLEAWCSECGENDPYQKDLTFMLEGMKDRTYPNESYLCEDILQLMEAGEGLGEYPEAVMLKKPEAKEEKSFYEDLNQIMKAGNAASGKCDNSGKTDLFGEMVTHIALKKGNDKVFEKYGDLIKIPTGQEEIFDMDVLKDILADTVVERAKYLAKYDDPDWAYDSHVFLMGEREDKSYSEDVSNWYGFKEDKINDQSVLFGCIDAGQQEKLKELQAVSIGKEEQRKAFYEKVLQPIEKECYASHEMIVERKNQYAKAQKEFLTQLETVQKLQAELDDYQSRMLRVLSDKETRERTIADAKGTMEHHNQLISDAETVRDGYSEDRKLLDKDLEEMGQIISDETAKIKELEKQINECKQKTAEGFSKSEEALKSVGFMTKLLAKKKYNEAVELSDQYHKEACDAQDNDLRLSKEAKNLGTKLHELLDQQAAMEEKRAFFTEEIAKRNRDINNSRQTIEKKEAEVAETEALLQESIADLEALKEEVKKAGENGKRSILDKTFVAELFSDEKDKADQRKKDIPWITPQYQTEREKLYLAAQKLCTEFARASHHCRENLITLEQYWGVRLDKENKKIEFHPTDKANMTASLYQTLFLLIPAVSVLTEETADMMEDFRKAGVFGRCIVGLEGKEAAEDTRKLLGTLFRCRHAAVFIKN